MLRAIYPGSFDPVTFGHLDIITRSSKIVDELIIGVLMNKAKTPLFSVEERVKMLNEVTTPIVSVRGNCDSEVDQMVLKFPILADYLLLAIGKKTIFVTHGHLYNKNNLPPLNKGDVLLCGHTHVQCYEEINDIVYMNCGSVSIPKEDGYHGYMIIEDNNITWKDLDGNVHLNKVM